MEHTLAPATPPTTNPNLMGDTPMPDETAVERFERASRELDHLEAEALAELERENTAPVDRARRVFQTNETTVRRVSADGEPSRLVEELGR